MKTDVYWLSLLALLRTWQEFLDTGCPIKDWDQLLEEYGENQAAAKFRLDTQLVRFRADCELFYHVSSVNLSWLEAHLMDGGLLMACISECQDCLNYSADVISLEDLYGEL